MSDVTLAPPEYYEIAKRLLEINLRATDGLRDSLAINEKLIKILMIEDGLGAEEDIDG